MPATPATPTTRPGWGPTASRTVTWHEPTVAAMEGAGMSGLDYLHAMIAGELPPPPISALFNMRAVSAEAGKVVFTAEPDASMYNPLGLVHGGVVCTLLDSALGCAAQSILPKGTGYTSIDISVSYLRPVTTDTGLLTATGQIRKPGRRVCFADGVVVDSTGRTVATATSSLLVIPTDA